MGSCISQKQQVRKKETYIHLVGLGTERFFFLRGTQKNADQSEEEKTRSVKRSLIAEINSFAAEMGEANFDFKTFSRIVPEFDGNKDKLAKFLRFGDKLYDTLNEAGIEQSNLHFTTKLSGKAFDVYDNTVDGN